MTICCIIIAITSIATMLALLYLCAVFVMRGGDDVIAMTVNGTLGGVHCLYQNMSCTLQHNNRTLYDTDIYKLN